MDTRLLLLALGGFAGSVESFLLGSLLPSIGSDVGVSVGQAGYLVFAYALVYAIGTPVLSTMFGGLDRRRLLVGGEFLFAAGALAMALLPQFGWLLAARICVALGAGLYTATALGTAVALAPSDRRGRAIGIVVAGQSFAVLAGVPAGALIASMFGWRAVYGIVAGLGLVAATALTMRLPSGLLGDKRTLLERVGVLRVHGVPLALLTTLLFMIGAYMPLIYIAPLASHSANIGQTLLPFVLLANGIGAFAGSNFGGRFADRVGVHRAFVVAAAAELLVLILLIVVPMLPQRITFAAFLLVIALSGFVGWGSWPAQSSRLAEIAPNSVPLALALNLTALNLGVALAAAIGGAIVDHAGPGYVALVALPFVGAAFVIGLLMQRGTRPAAATS